MLDSLEIAIRDIHIHDGGPYYHEFISDAVIKEPWNAYSSLFFFVPIIYWIWKLRGVYKDHLIIITTLPFLFLNGLGSTLYHAFRSEPMFLYLDSVPASLMSIIISIYFWTKIVVKWYLAVLIVASFYGAGILSLNLLLLLPSCKEMGPNIAYLFVGAAFLIPLLLYLRKINFQHGKYVLYTFFFLIMALLCRISDHPNTNPIPEIIPQGTHFMWHIFSALAVFSLGYFIYYSSREDPKPKEDIGT
jgi:hypothetical protein